MKTIIVAIVFVLILLASHTGTYYVGHNDGVNEESARTMKAVTESVAAMQTAMATLRTESRKELEQKDREIRTARAAIAARFTNQVKNNEALANCLPVTVRTDTVWLQ